MLRHPDVLFRPAHAPPGFLHIINRQNTNVPNKEEVSFCHSQEHSTPARSDRYRLGVFSFLTTGFYVIFLPNHLER